MSNRLNRPTESQVAEASPLNNRLTIDSENLSNTKMDAETKRILIKIIIDLACVGCGMCFH